MRDVPELRDKIIPVLLPYGVMRVAIFGSMARGEEGVGVSWAAMIETRPLIVHEYFRMNLTTA